MIAQGAPLAPLYWSPQDYLHLPQEICIGHRTAPVYLLIYLHFGALLSFIFIFKQQKNTIVPYMKTVNGLKAIRNHPSQVK